MVKTREITLLTWNLKDGLSDPERADSLAERIAEIAPDVAIFSEGAAEGHEVNRSARRLLERHVGTVYQADYADFDMRRDRHRLVAAARPEFGEPAVLSNFGRNGFYFTPDKLPVRIAGLHGYDRHHGDVKFSDEARVRQMRHVLSRLALEGDDQAIILGDLNAMYPNHLIPGLLRLATPLFDRLPYKNPDEDQNRRERLGSITQRLGQMAIGGPLRELADAGFYNVDPSRHPTMRLAGPIGVQLDHILARRAELYAVKTHDPHGLIDHHGVSAKAAVFLRKKGKAR